MLERLSAAGKLSAEDFEQLHGERLCKKHRKPDGSHGYAGNGDYMKASQYSPSLRKQLLWLLRCFFCD